VIVTALIMIVMLGVAFLPRGPSLTDAESLLLAAPMNNTPGNAFVTCHHTGFLGLLGDQDKCTLRYSSGPVFRCPVVPGEDSVGPAASCDGPFRR
jgi:hypothetical protein